MSGAEILSMRLVVAAGLSGPGAAVAISTSCPHRPAAPPGPVVGKASSHWYGGRVVVMRYPFYLPCPSTPLRGTVRAFSRQAGLLRPLLTSAPRSDHLAMASVPKDTAQISWGKPRSFPRSPAGFTAMALDGFATGCPLHTCLRSDSCSSGRDFAPRFLQTVPRGSALALRSYFTSIRLYGGLSPPSCWACPAHSLALRATAFGGCGLDRAGPPDPRSTIGMKGMELLLPSRSMKCGEREKAP
jgi:hypothetical protein